jgi:hypothetical protein
MTPTEIALFRRLHRLIVAVSKTHRRANRKIRKIIKRLTADS